MKKKLFSLFLSLIIIASIGQTVSLASNEPEKNSINIAMATDNNYVLPTIVAITSMLENVNEDSFYKFYLLISEDFTKENEEKFLTLEKRYKEKCLINFLKMDNEFDNNITLPHITSATYFRLRLPSLLQNEEKCLYLDGDIIVLKDLVELYNTDITDYYIAGVKEIGVQVFSRKRNEKLDIPDVEKYVNAGILLMNLKKMRQDNIEQKFNEFIPLLEERNLSLADQDVLNSVCYEKIYNLPFKYNVRANYFAIMKNNTPSSHLVKQNFTGKEWVEAKKRPVIIHYAVKTKPWNNPTMPYGDLWCEYARKTDYFKATA